MDLELDGLSNLMSGDFSVAGTTAGTDEIHPRFAQYKNEGRIRESQQRRRREALERQKEKRSDYVNKLRRIAVGEELEEDEEDEVPTDTAPESNSKPRKFSNRLMLSEWLVDIPEQDRLSGDWLMVPSPRGRRCLLVASSGVTSAYAKSGYRVAQFQSRLPGGSRRDAACCTLIDGVIDVKKGIFYALDILMWKDNPLDDSDYACRHFVLESRISENQLFSEKSRQYPYQICALPACRCTQEEMEKMMNENTDYYLDGLLFYHSQVLYSPGQNPLVGWLKPWMLPEILNVTVPHKYMTKNEEEKGGAFAFIQKFNAEHNHKSMISAGATMED